MAEAAFVGDHECPVCREEFTEPKLLSCTHRVCKNCLLSWLHSEGEGGCPLCHAPILSDASGRTDATSGDVTALVDSLPTDLATMALLESKGVLSSNDVCCLCIVTGISVLAPSFCLDCSMKLCVSCVKAHQRIPATRQHVLEQLSTLTAERLAARHQSSCDSHPDRLAELYCPEHQILICLLCASSTHRSCSEVEGIAEVAKKERAALTDQAGRLRQKEAAVSVEIAALEQEAADAQKHFKSAKDDANLIFDRLQESLEKQRQETITTLQSQEDELVSGKKAEKTSMDCQRAAISTQVHALEQFLTSSPDSTLVGMLNKLKQRLDSLEGQPHARQLVKPAGAWECDVCMVQNTMDAYKCVACESPKPSPKSAGASAPSNTPSSTTARSGRPDARFLTPAGAWECGMGMAQNKEKVSTYFTSESRKPAPKSAGASAPSNTPSSTTARCGRPSAPSNTPSSTTGRSGRPSAPSNTPSFTTARSGRPDARFLKPAGAWECGMGMAQNKEKVYLSKPAPTAAGWGPRAELRRCLVPSPGAEPWIQHTSGPFGSWKEGSTGRPMRSVKRGRRK